VFGTKCPVCGTENPGGNHFCSSCGKPLPLPQAQAGSARQPPVPQAPKGSGPGLFLLVGGLLVFILIIGVGLVVVLPLFADEPAGSPETGSAPRYPAPSGDVGQNTIPSGSGENPGSPTFAAPAPGSSATPEDLIVGTWDIQSTALQMEFGADGSATLRDTKTGEYDTGSWQRISDGKYRIRSPSGTEYPVLLADPIAGTMYLEDHSMVFIRRS
jgi:hypothetical protein